jgi:hypothetical protein
MQGLRVVQKLIGLAEEKFGQSMCIFKSFVRSSYLLVAVHRDTKASVIKPIKEQTGADVSLVLTTPYIFKGFEENSIDGPTINMDDWDSKLSYSNIEVII